jgi:hypothetical protein
MDTRRQVDAALEPAENGSFCLEKEQERNITIKQTIIPQ